MDKQEKTAPINQPVVTTEVEPPPAPVEKPTPPPSPAPTEATTTPQKSSPKLLTVLVAILLISLVGVGYLIITKSQPQEEPIAPEITETPLFLSLDSPTDESVVLGDEITVKGKTLPSSTVVFYTDTNQGSVESDTSGQFEGTLALASGINSLTVTAFDTKGEEKTMTLDLVYDDQVMGVKTTTNKENENKETGAGQKITIGGVEKVGTSSLTLQGKNKKTEVKIDSKTKIIGQDRKALNLNAIKLKDLAAVVSTESGEATDSGLLKKALKIFVKEATTAAQSKRRAVYGVITEITDNTITISHPVHPERTKYSVIVNDETLIKIKGIEAGTLADLKVGLRIAAVGDLNEAGLIVAKRIHVIPGKATGLFEKNPVATASGSPIATASASPSSTPSASPSSSPSASPTSSPSASPTSTPSL